jgi:hypothetical protein
MHIIQPPMKTVTTSHTCAFHKLYPGINYPGCTCSGSITTVVKPMNEWTEAERRFMADPFTGYTPNV